MTVYELHGLRMRSEVRLAGAPPSMGEPDVGVRWGDRVAVPDASPAGTVVAKLSINGTPAYTHTRGAGGFTLRFHRTCEFRISTDLRRMTVHVDHRADAAMASVLLAGNVAAFLLAQRGACVLHASAVAMGDRAVAFVGGSGQGKSTIAAALSGAGARFITDDLLHVRREGVIWRCHGGPSEIRLRRDASVAHRFARRGVTPDGRTALYPEHGAPETRLALAAILLPRPTRDAATPTLHQLSPGEGLAELLRAPRVVACDAGLLQRQFIALGALVRAVPVVVAVLPWGAPRLHETLLELLDSMGLRPDLVSVPA